jgi:hypothetical protein
MDAGELVPDPGRTAAKARAENVVDIASAKAIRTAVIRIPFPSNLHECRFVSVGRVIGVHGLEILHRLRGLAACEQELAALVPRLIQELWIAFLAP